jgi:hypothetical protein
MNRQQTIYASAARTATPTAVVVNMRHATAMRLVLVATAITATPSVVVTVDQFDNASGTYVNVRTEAAVATVSTNVFTLMQGLTGLVRITATHGDADSITYSLNAHLTR